MGEYANYMGQRVKIGTCESMYYLRWDQRGKVTNSETPLYDPEVLEVIRLACLVGEYESHVQHARLLQQSQPLVETREFGQRDGFGPGDVKFIAEGGLPQLRFERRHERVFRVLLAVPLHIAAQLADAIGHADAPVARTPGRIVAGKLKLRDCLTRGDVRTVSLSLEHQLSLPRTPRRER